MRLRKNFKRTAAAALALSMAVSTATPAMAGYKIDMSKVSDDVTIEQNEDADGNTSITIKVGNDDKTADFVDESTGVNDITVTGDNREDNRADAAEGNRAAGSGNDTGNDTRTVSGSDAATTAQPADAAGISTMDLTPEDYAPAGDAQDDPEAPDADAQTDSEGEAQEPERTVTETEDGTVISYGEYEVDPDVQVTPPPPQY